MYLSLHNVISVTIKPSQVNKAWRQLVIKHKEMGANDEWTEVEDEIMLFCDDNSTITINRVFGDQVELIEA